MSDTQQSTYTLPADIYRSARQLAGKERKSVADILKQALGYYQKLTIKPESEDKKKVNTDWENSMFGQIAKFAREHEKELGDMPVENISGNADKYIYGV